MKIHKQGITFVLLLLVFTSCSRKPSLQWIPFSWEGDTISGIYIEKAFLNVPVKIGTPIHEIGTVVYLANEKSELGYIVISDEIKEDSKGQTVTLYLH